MVKATTNIQSGQTVLAVPLTHSESEAAKAAAERYGLSVTAYLALAVRERLAVDAREISVAVAEGIDLSQGFDIIREDGESDDDFARRKAVLTEALVHAGRSSQG